MRAVASPEQRIGAWWVPGDWNAFFGLFSNVLLNLIVLSGLMLGVIGVPPEIVFGRIIPAVGLSLIVGNLYYAYMARRLARKEQRSDVAALPYGPSVPHYFLVTFVIMLPVVLQTKDPILAWRVGLAWAFLEGIIEFLGAFAAKYIQRYTPRAAMLGTLAGISITFISMAPAMQMLEVPWLAFLSLGLILLAWFAMVPMPYNIPGGLLIIVLGTVVGWLTGTMSAPAVGAAVAHFGLSLPSLGTADLLAGMADFAPLLVTAIPMGIYNFTEAMNNVESAAAAGDTYSVREGCLVDGIGSLLGTLLGSPFPTAMYIGHPGWKALGGRIGYSLATGLAVAVVCLLGILPLMLAIIPVWTVLPILVYIGAVIGSQAFQTSPLRHAPAVILALIPNLAAWAVTLVHSTLAAAGTSVDKVGLKALSAAPIFYQGMQTLGQGAILVGLLWAAIGVFAIEQQWKEATIYALIGVVLSFFGIIHGAQIQVAAAWQMSIGYLILGGLMLLAPRFQDFGAPTAPKRAA